MGLEYEHFFGNSRKTFQSGDGIKQVIENPEKQYHLPASDHVGICVLNIDELGFNGNAEPRHHEIKRLLAAKLGMSPGIIINSQHPASTAPLRFNRKAPVPSSDINHRSVPQRNRREDGFGFAQYVQSGLH